MNTTAQLNMNAIEYVRAQIAKKNSSSPYFANGTSIANVITDYDHTPYDRWFRGVYYFPDPVIAEREAGFRPIQNSCYEVVQKPKETKQFVGCFEPPCSTVFPCISAETDYEKVRDKHINMECLVEYR